ncbi:MULTISPECIES: eCIS core domain-containing protein [Janthinobacterium]|uniref:DUF4157 domain-containing protein n=1 Tax=Janthinobacterium kumbetense TaxID=2950280 RepID=A0ABT0WSQ0_9BURK|nr:MULTISPECIES: DUF4157 domain-containing protein [Janthinobacterium]MCM2567086.1 DUF4157 domain-containing protein [Janthinobacterium kumbetense]MED5614073.1 DUF4157 domain-containing protein [Janthinobacterium sp. P210005]
MATLSRATAGWLVLAGILFHGTAATAGCPDCQYEACAPLVGCVCLPKSGCILPPAIDPGKVTERGKTDPIGTILNPLAPLNPTGIPTTGDIIEFVVKNPDTAIQLIQNPGQIPYTPVATAMVSARNAVVTSGNANSMAPEIKAFLLRWHTPDLLDSVRWTSEWSALQNTLQAAQMQFNSNTRAITVLNAVIFRSDDDARDPALWAHEMLHVQQYKNWGVTGFAKQWVDNSSDGGPVEAPAYARENEARLLLSSHAGNRALGVSAFYPPIPQKLPSGWMLTSCQCWGSVSPAAQTGAPVCQSGIAIPRACGPAGICGDGGAPWQTSCL